jgi:hypothetical protein
MRGFHNNSSFDPQTLVLLETAFDEAWWTLKSVGNKTVKPDELARSVLRLAMEGERGWGAGWPDTGDRLARSKLIALIAPLMSVTELVYAPTHRNRQCT